MAEQIAQAVETSGLAITSLVLAIATIVLGPLGYIPAIICGHLAKAEIRRKPTLSGMGLANAGLIIGYLCLVLTILVILVIVGFMLLIGFAAAHSGAMPMH